MPAGNLFIASTWGAKHFNKFVGIHPALPEIVKFEKMQIQAEASSIIHFNHPAKLGIVGIIPVRIAGQCHYLPFISIRSEPQKLGYSAVEKAYGMWKIHFFQNLNFRSTAGGQ